MKPVAKNGPWEPLKRGAFRVDARQKGVDPMWVWADATGYRDFGRGRAQAEQQGLWFAVEQPREPSAKYAVFAGQRLKPKQWAAMRDQAALVELAESVVPERAPVRIAVAAPGRARSRERSSSDVLVGIIDSGCPFAARMIRDQGGKGNGTRVLALWDQDDRAAFTECGGRVPKGFDYGSAVNRAQLNRLMKQASSPDGQIDEDLCYRLAGYDAVNGRFSHGAAVMSQLFVPHPIGEPSQAQDGHGVVDAADLVFVQAPRAAVQDSTSAALTRHLADGLRFIVEHARKGVTQRIVVNISSGTSRTSHDGNSMIERMLSAYVDEVRERFGIDLWVVVPVGNANEEQRHAVLSHAEQHLEFFLPPGSEMPQYVTVRWPENCDGVHLRVTPPAGEAGTIRQGEAKGWPDAARPECGVVSPRPQADANARSLIAFAPTASHDPGRTLARSGRWRFELVFDDPLFSLGDDRVMFWISRNQRNPGALARGRQADFVDWDEAHNPKRYLRRELDDPPDLPVADGIRRCGALSGMATLARPDRHVVVVGGLVAGDLKQAPSRYSASGPAANTAGSRRLRPDVSVTSDSNWSLPGLSVRANRSGDVVRVIGTSFAAPLVARTIANFGQFALAGDAADGSARRGEYRAH